MARKKNGDRRLFAMARVKSIRRETTNALHQPHRQDERTGGIFGYSTPMPPQAHRRNARTPRRRRRSRRHFTFAPIGRFVQYRWRELRTFLHALGKTPPAVRVLVSAMLLLVLWLTVNWMYHAFNKPTEVLFPLDNALDKSPTKTWQEYGSLFREHSTAVITPELLAALAQVEGTGNPVARTYWRWRQTWNPLEWYQPASSAVGMYQLTDGTFQAAQRYCIHDHEVVEDGPWHNLQSCWFNSLYTRVVPSHAIELTAALLTRNITSAIGHRRTAAATLLQKQDLAAVIHLCGAGAGRDYARRGFRLSPSQRCGDHDVSTYLARVSGLKQQFARLAAGDRRDRLVSPH